MSDDVRCATCVFWRRDLPPVTTGWRRPTGADDQLGTCEYASPFVLMLGGAAVSMQPETHEDRACGEWMGDGECPTDRHRAPADVISFADRRPRP